MTTQKDSIERVIETFLLDGNLDAAKLIVSKSAIEFTGTCLLDLTIELRKPLMTLEILEDSELTFRVETLCQLIIKDFDPEIVKLAVERLGTLDYDTSNTKSLDHLCQVIYLLVSNHQEDAADQIMHHLPNIEKYFDDPYEILIERFVESVITQDFVFVKWCLRHKICVSESLPLYYVERLQQTVLEIATGFGTDSEMVKVMLESLKQ